MKRCEYPHRSNVTCRFLVPGDALSYVNTSLEPEFEYQRDPKGAASLLKMAQVMLMSRGPKYCSQVDEKRGIAMINSRKNMLANTVLKRKSDESLMESLRRGEPLPLYREGEDVRESEERKTRVCARGEATKRCVYCAFLDRRFAPLRCECPHRSNVTCRFLVAGREEPFPRAGCHQSV